MLIEELQWDDQVNVIELAASVFPWSLDNLKSCFTESYQNFGVWNADELVAFLLVHKPLQDEWTIMNIAVKPTAQRQGIATKLIQFIGQAAQRQQATLFLEVRESNMAARTLYKQNGFVEIGRRQNYYPSNDGHREAAVVMSLAPQDYSQ